MKHVLQNLFVASFLLFASVQGHAQSCCQKPGDMKLLAMDASFKAAHEAPEPLNYVPETGNMIEFPAKGGATGHAFYVPSPKPTNKVLIVVHEWWGLNDYIKREAENWQKELGNIDVYAIDLYDGQVATNADEAGKLMGGLKAERGAAIVNGLLAKIGKGKKIATIGWCMGGSWSFTSTVLAGKSAAGCVMYYGFHEKDMKKIAPLKADVLYIRGSQDTYITKESVEQLEKDVTKTGRTFTLYSFAAVHAFANPSNPKYDEPSATRAHGLSLEFLKKHLKM